MFTGLVEETGTLVSSQPCGGGRELAIRACRVHEGLVPGDSLSVHGACQTVTSVAGTVIRVLAAGATLAKTTLGSLRPGDRVHLERACTLSTRLGGHLVQGHVSARARFLGRREQDGAWLMTFLAPPEVLDACPPEGSVCIDGASLTIASTEADRFTVSVIPHTLSCTTLASLLPGREVNLETDFLVRAVLHHAARHRPGWSASLADWGYR